MCNPTENIPGLTGENRIALIIARLLATGWSTYAVWRTMNISDRLQNLIQNPDTPCHFDLYQPYFTKRTSLQVWITKIIIPPLFLSLLLARGPCLALGCASYIPHTLLAPLQSIHFSFLPPANFSLLTYTRSMLSIHLGALVHRKTSCGCMRYGLVFHSTRAACIDKSFHSIFSRFWSASSCLFSSW